jgi:HAD superfamily hydrolase (TIGR01509 family)
MEADGLMEYGFIFDYDGVLMDSMEVHYRANVIALGEINVPMDKNKYFSQAGMTGVEQVESFCEEAGVTADYEAVYKRKKEIFSTMIHEVTRIERNLEFYNTLISSGAKVAVATGCSRETLETTSEHLDIFVPVSVCGGEVERGKPNPDLFLEAARLLGLAPSKCTVIEDSDAGAEAAAAAGMACLRYYQCVGREDE